MILKRTVFCCVTWLSYQKSRPGSYILLILSQTILQYVSFITFILLDGMHSWTATLNLSSFPPQDTLSLQNDPHPPCTTFLTDLSVRFSHCPQTWLADWFGIGDISDILVNTLSLSYSDFFFDFSVYRVTFPPHVHPPIHFSSHPDSVFEFSIKKNKWWIKYF